MERILVTGGGGYLAARILEVMPEASAPRFDIADFCDVCKAFDDFKPTIVINAAGKTGRPNVDWCEDHPIETYRSNVIGPLLLAEECLKRGIYFVHIGSGCIYSGDNNGKGWSEEDAPNFTGSYYSLTKATSDQLLRVLPILQLRLRMPFDDREHPRNLITKLTKYQRVLDTQNSITYIPDFLHVLQTLVAKKATGIYNVTNPGTVSPYEVMSLYKKVVRPSHSFERLDLDKLGTVTKAGRSNCVLSSEKLRREGIGMKTVNAALMEGMQRLAI